MKILITEKQLERLKDNLINEIGDGSLYFNTSLEKTNNDYFFNINDDNFEHKDFYIYIKLITFKDFIKMLNKTTDMDKINKDEIKDNVFDTIEVSFGFFDDYEGWTFPTIGDNNIFKIMGTVTQSIKYVMNEHKNINYIVYKPTHRKINNVTDNGQKRKNLYSAYMKKHFTNVDIEEIKGWVIVSLE
jgi:hypothetical protein